jgi:ABC-type transport system substrate-binding protein
VAAQALFFLSILAVNKPAIIEGLWKGTGSATPFMHWYYPFNKGYSQEWTIPPYDLKRAKELLTEAGAANGFEIAVNPMVFTYALDGPDVMEAVALDGVMLGMKSTTWALSKKVSAWSTLLSVPLENNYEYVTPV